MISLVVNVNRHCSLSGHCLHYNDSRDAVEVDSRYSRREQSKASFVFVSLVIRHVCAHTCDHSRTMQWHSFGSRRRRQETLKQHNKKGQCRRFPRAFSAAAAAATTGFSRFLSRRKETQKESPFLPCFSLSFLRGARSSRNSSARALPTFSGVPIATPSSRDIHARTLKNVALSSLFRVFFFSTDRAAGTARRPARKSVGGRR